MAKDKEKEKEYKRIGYLRAQTRKENRRHSRENRKYRYAKKFVTYVEDICLGVPVVKFGPVLVVTNMEHVNVLKIHCELAQW